MCGSEKKEDASSQKPLYLAENVVCEVIHGEHRLQSLQNLSNVGDGATLWLQEGIWVVVKLRRDNDDMNMYESLHLARKDNAIASDVYTSKSFSDMVYAVKQ